jgi:hypothetical protein
MPVMFGISSNEEFLFHEHLKIERIVICKGKESYCLLANCGGP